MPGRCCNIESQDPKLSQAEIEMRTGQRWSTAEAVDVVESWLWHRALVGAVTHGRAGLVSSTTSRYNKAQGKARRSLMQQKVQAAVEEERASRMVGMGQRGAWTRWEHAALWKEEHHCIQFLIQAVYDVLPSPSNLFSWGLAGVTSLQPLPEERDPGAHPQQRFEGTG